MIDEKFGLLTVKAYIGDRQKKTICQCQCGNLVEIWARDLLLGKRRGCGCDKKERSGAAQFKHGHAANERNSPTMKSYWGARSRCTNPNHPRYADYGGSGVQMCERWLESFSNFLEDMGIRPDGTSLDRIDTKGNYEPSNCRWSTYKEQVENRSISLSVDVDGVRVSLSDFAKMHGVRYNSLWQRMRKFSEPATVAVLRMRTKKPLSGPPALL